MIYLQPSRQGFQLQICLDLKLWFWLSYGCDSLGNKYKMWCHFMYLTILISLVMYRITVMPKTLHLQKLIKGPNGTDSFYKQRLQVSIAFVENNNDSDHCDLCSTYSLGKYYMTYLNNCYFDPHILLWIRYYCFRILER